MKTRFIRLGNSFGMVVGTAAALGWMWLTVPSALADVNNPSAPFCEVFNLPGDEDRLTITPSGNLPRSAQFNINTGGSLGSNLTAFESELNVQGGTIGNRLTLEGSVLNLRDGQVESATLTFGSVANVSGGSISALSVGDDSLAFPSGGSASISGGTVENLFVGVGSSLTILGGTVNNAVTVLETGKVNIRGGSFLGTSVPNNSTGFPFFEFGVVNIFGRGLLIDGQPIPGLVPDVPVDLIDFSDGNSPSIEVSGQLQDGSPFTFTYFAETPATFTLVIPEPSSLLLLGLGMTPWVAGRYNRRKKVSGTFN